MISYLVVKQLSKLLILMETCRRIKYIPSNGLVKRLSFVFQNFIKIAIQETIQRTFSGLLSICTIRFQEKEKVY